MFFPFENTGPVKVGSHTGTASVVLLRKVPESKNKKINSPWGVVVFSHLDKRPKPEEAAGDMEWRNHQSHRWVPMS